jgi:protein ImuB
MGSRFVSIWFPHLLTDAHCCNQPDFITVPLAIAAPERGRMKIKGVNNTARQKGIDIGMVVADCRAIFPGLQVVPYRDGLEKLILNELALWSFCYTPVVSVDEPDGLLLNASGCTHLWGSETDYLKVIVQQLQQKGFAASVAIADTIGMAWAAARYYQSPVVIKTGRTTEALIQLSSAALRLDPIITEKLDKLGLYRIGDFIDMPKVSLRKRFGNEISRRLEQATGKEKEYLQPVIPPVHYQERLPCVEPVCTAAGIEIALKKLLAVLCSRLLEDARGVRAVQLKGFRIDGNIQQIAIGTNKPSRHTGHLFKLFELKIATLEPGLGIELFLLEAPVVEDMPIAQESIWKSSRQNADALAELLDRITGKLGTGCMQRYLPQAHYWPERAMKAACSLQETPAMQWPLHKPRPTHLLKEPEPIEVSVPVPDYPPMLFIHQGKIHKIKKADGPERIEQEWWIEQGLHRDYYYVEDEAGARYWLFRSGHYSSDEEPKWFLHGFFG